MGKDNGTPWQFWVPAREAISKRKLVVRDDDSGIYALVLRLSEPRWVVAGGLGRCRLTAGWYIYVGSAKRNLAARLARHLRSEKRTHWHIDYLRALVRVEEIWLCPWAAGAECRTNERIQALPGATVPWKGFGSSDCDCLSHLARFDAVPTLRESETRICRVIGRAEFLGLRAKHLTRKGKGRILPFAR